MDFDDAKENIQPLAAGRNASILQAALHAESHQELQQQRRNYENEIQNYEGEDPLEPWFEYIYWIEQSFPSGGKESGLEEVLLKCLTKFEKEELYHQDRRMIKLYIKYIDTHENPQECYQQLYNQGIGTMVADLYICWAYYYDLSGNFRKADQIFRKGIDCRAQPLEELQEAHQHFGFTMSQRILYDDDNSKQKYQSTLQEKRQALTSLKSHRKKVGSVRTGSAVKSYAPGKVQVNAGFTGSNSRGGNVSVRVYEDENQDPNPIPVVESAPDTSKSVVKTILDSARKRENVKEPGPWNKAHDKKKGILFASDSRPELGFEILEDEEVLGPIKGNINYGKPFIYYDGFVPRNQPQEEWNLPVTLENELVPRSYPSYDKCLLYPQPNMEYSPEELRGYFWYTRRNIENNYTKKYDTIWKPNLNSGMRMYPNFAKKNIPDTEEPRLTVFDPSEVNVRGESKLVFDPKLCYPSPEEDELQFEEIMFRRWKSGERKLKYGGNETIAMMEEMEETVCMPKEAARRKSFFPTRKSVAPSQFARHTPHLEETEEEEPSTAPLPRRSVIMKTPKKPQREDPSIQIYEDEADDSAFAFKAPSAPPVKPQKLNFQIYEEEENNYEANETCSTQVFNCFIKAQSVSTPKAPAKVMKPTPTERQPTNLNFEAIENVPIPTISNPNPSTAFSPPEYNDAGLTMQCKQLSTIMETSEHATVNTASTKSSISSAEFETEGHQSRIPLINNACTLQTVQETGSLPEKDFGDEFMKSLRIDDDAPTVRQHNEFSRLEQREDTVPLMPTVKIYEDKTETVPRMLFAKAGNFSRMEDREDTTPSIKPVKFHEDKTETITKMIIAPRKPTLNEIPPDDELLDFFAKSPEKGASSAAKNIFTPPPAPVANKSIFTASAFMNFQDSPDAKQKCLYDSPELRAKCSSLMGTKKSSNLSFLPNFDDPMETDRVERKKNLESSFLPNLSATSGDQRRPKTTEDSFLVGKPSQQTKEDSFQHGGSLRRQQSKEEPAAGGILQRQQSREDSFLPGFPKDTSASGAALPRQKSTEDSFLSGFPSVNVGANKSREDSFMSYLSSVGAPKSKQAAEDSFMKKFSSTVAEEKTRKETSFHSQQFSSSTGEAKPRVADTSKSDPFMMNLSTAQKQKQDPSMPPRNGGDAFMNSFKMTEDSFMPHLSTTSDAQKKKAMGESFMPNLSTMGDSFLKSATKTENSSVRAASRIPKPPQNAGSFSVPGENVSSRVSFLGQQKVSLTEKPTKVSFLGKPMEDSFQFNFSISPQKPSKISFLGPEKSSGEEKPQIISKIASQRSQNMNQSQSNSTFSLLRSFNTTEPPSRKQPEQAQKFEIFEDSACQPKETNKFTIFEDSSCQKGTSLPPANQKVYCDVSLRPDDFFEDNIRTEAFAPNLSMIKNSTWLPNHDPRQSQIMEQSLHIKTDPSICSTSLREKSHGLSIFSSVPQEKSIDLMPPPPPMMKPKVSLKPTKPTVVTSPPANECIEIPESDEESDGDDLGKSIYYTKTPKTPKVARHAWSPELQQTPDMNEYFVHKQVDLDHTQQVIDEYCVSKDVNPFNRKLMDAFLFQIEFTSYIEKLPTCDMVRKIKPLSKDSTIGINGKTFNVLKLIGEGSYGSVYCAKEPQSGRLFALKQERPANLWEYYICLELRSRLKSTEILTGFQDIEYALIGNNAGVLVSKFSRYGSLITVCNKIKKETLKNVDEYVVMHMASQLLLIMDHLHASNIIHADVKPDNFLLMEKLVPGRKQPTIQLIDFGTSIDMDLFKKGQTFRFIHDNESFKCAEMHEKRPWTYQLDLFGLAGVIHVLLFGKYMEIVKKPAGWTHRSHVPRYFNKSLWETIFHGLLNIDNCQTMPNLQNLRAQIKEEIAEKDKSVCQKIVEFNRVLDL